MEEKTLEHSNRTQNYIDQQIFNRSTEHLFTLNPKQNQGVAPVTISISTILKHP